MAVIEGFFPKRMPVLITSPNSHKVLFTYLILDISVNQEGKPCNYPQGITKTLAQTRITQFNFSVKLIPYRNREQTSLSVGMCVK